MPSTRPEPNPAAIPAFPRWLRQNRSEQVFHCTSLFGCFYRVEGAVIRGGGAVLVDRWDGRAEDPDPTKDRRDRHWHPYQEVGCRRVDLAANLRSVMDALPELVFARDSG